MFIDWKTGQPFSVPRSGNGAVRRVLFFRFDTYGDLLLTSGLIAQLAEYFHGAEFHLLTRERYLDLSTVFPVRMTWHGTGLEPLQIPMQAVGPESDIWDVLNQHWDYAISTCFNRTWLDDGIIRHVSSAGVPVVRLAKGGAPLECLPGVSTVFVSEASHELEKYSLLAASVIGRSELARPDAIVPASARSQAAVLCADLGLEPGKFLICTPGGLNQRLRLWPAERFADCLGWLEKSHGLRALVIGSTAEAEVVAEVARTAHLYGASPATWLGGNGQIDCLSALIAESRLYFGNDTGPAHFAQALGIPAITIFGGGHWPRFSVWGKGVSCVAEMPCFGCNWQCLFGSALCVQSVSVGQVKQALSNVLSGSAGEREVSSCPAAAIGPQQIRDAASNFRDLSVYASGIAVAHQHAVRRLAAGRDGASQSSPNEIAREKQRVEVELACANDELQSRESQIAELTRKNEKLSADLEGIQTRLERMRKDPLEFFLGSSLAPPAPFAFEQSAEAGVISVVIPVYNAALFLKRCVESVWKQDIPIERIQLIVVDDGSTDSSLELARSMQAESPCPMLVLTHEGGRNRGVSATRNRGLTESRGEFIALLDADDAWLPNRLSVQLDYVRAHAEVGCVCSYGYNRDLEGKDVIGWSGSKLAGDYSENPGTQPFRNPYTFEQLLKGDPIVNSTVLIRREAIEQFGAYPDVMAHQAEDWFLFAKLSLWSPIHLLAVPLIEYTIHPESYTTQYVTNGLGRGAQLEFLHYLLHWMISRPDLRPKAEWALRRFYPALASAPYRCYRILEGLYEKNNGQTATVADFEDHLSGVYEELAQLKHYRDVIEQQLAVLRRIPGLVPFYHWTRKVFKYANF